MALRGVGRHILGGLYDLVARRYGNHPGEDFQSLLLRLRGRAGLTQREIAVRLGMHRRSVQGWESGTNFPSEATLRTLLVVFLAANAFTEGREWSEAEAVWQAALRDAPRVRSLFDPVWFGGLLARQMAAKETAASRALLDATAAPAIADHNQDWGQAPSIGQFQGRLAELREVERWILAEHCRVVALLGAGGIGKTMLAARLADRVAHKFERVYWRSLRDAPLPSDWLAGAINFVADYREPPPHGEPARLSLLLGLMRKKTCLLVLDNFETVLQPGGRVGVYRQAYDGYGALVRLFAESDHRSCLLLTSREAPPELGPLAGEHGPVRMVQLVGMDPDAIRAMLGDKVLRGDDENWAQLVDRYAGNALALRIASEVIRRLFGGDIAAFLRRNEQIFGGIRDLLDEQFGRLSDPELTLLRWLAVEREPVGLDVLSADLGPKAPGATLLETIESVRGRSLLAEPTMQDNAYTLTSVVLEYVTDRLAEDATQEIVDHQPRHLLEYPLVKATSRDDTRRTQERLIAGPVLDGLRVATRDSALIEQRINQVLDLLRTRPLAEQGYAPGNLINLLRLLRGNLRGADLSGLAIRQAYLQDIEAQDASLAGARLSESILPGSFAYPSSVALSADGMCLASGSAKGDLNAWRVKDRSAVFAVPAHAGAVMGVALSPDGSLIASGGLDGFVKVWETLTGKLLASIAAHDGGVWGLALSQDGRMLASGGGDGGLKVWRVDGGELLIALAAHEAQVWGVALSADGSLLASGSVNTVRIWDTLTGHMRMSLDQHTGVVMGVALSSDGQLLASGGHDGTVRLWRAASGEHVATLGGHHGPVYRVALSADGHVLASAGHDGTLRLWSTERGELRSAIQAHTGQAYAVSMSADGNLAASGSQDGTVKLWDTSTSGLIATLRGFGGGIRGVALSADGRLIASAGADAAVRLWDATSGKVVATLTGYTGLVPAVALSDDGHLLATGESDGTIKIWQTTPPQLLSAIAAHDSSAVAVAMSSDGRLVVSGGLDEMVKVWDAATGRLLSRFQAHVGGVRSLSLGAHGRSLVSGGHDTTVKLWQVPAGQLLATLEGHAGQVFGVSLSTDGCLIASSGIDGYVKLWNAESARLIRTLEGHVGGAWAVALSRDGRLAISGGQDASVRVWDTKTGQLLASLGGHTDAVWAVAVSGDGQRVASGCIDGTVRLWDVVTSTALRTLRGDRRFERLDITGLTGATPAQWDGLTALGAQSRQSR